MTATTFKYCRRQRRNELKKLYKRMEKAVELGRSREAGPLRIPLYGMSNFPRYSTNTEGFCNQPPPSCSIFYLSHGW